MQQEYTFAADLSSIFLPFFRALAQSLRTGAGVHRFAGGLGLRPHGCGPAGDYSDTLEPGPSLHPNIDNGHGRSLHLHLVTTGYVHLEGGENGFSTLRPIGGCVGGGTGGEPGCDLGARRRHPTTHGHGRRSHAEYGPITSAFPGRDVQFALKFYW